MKRNLRQIKQECKLFYTENAATYFAKGFSKKMGGTQTITFEDEFLPEIKLDKKEYYTGRGAKYNNQSMHEHIDVFVSKKDFNDRVNYRATSIFNQQKENAETNKKMSDFCKKYGLKKSNYNGFSESMGLFFALETKNLIEKELDVDLTEFFNATGKTYYFTKSKIGLLEFYHNHGQSYSFNFTTEEEINEFKVNRDSWIDAPYAHILGQTNNIDLYVC